MMSRHTIIATACILGILFFGAGCGSDGSGGSSDTSILEEEGFVEEGVSTIGFKGGSLKAEDFELIVPPGAFETDTELTLYGSDSQPFGENSSSRTFKIEGFPKTFSSSILVKVRYQEPLIGEYLVAIGVDAHVHSLDETQTSYYLLPAEESDGYLIIEMMPETENALSSADLVPTNDRELNTIDAFMSYLVNVVSGYQTWFSGDSHFAIAYPDHVSASDAGELGVYLETAYQQFQKIGFDYSRRTRWPVSVTVKDLGSQTLGLFSTYGIRVGTGPNSFYNSGTLQINSRRIGDRTALKATAGHEFFHFVQDLYLPNWDVTISKYSWLDEACSAWSEALFVNGHISETRIGNQRAPLEGAQRGAIKNSIEYGYGMSAMIKYLVSTAGYKQDFLLPLYQKVSEDEDPFGAVFETTAPPDSWWHHFLSEYLVGNIYDDFNIFGWEETIQVSFAQDTEKTITRSYPDLSGKLFKISLKDAAITDNTSMKFDIPQGYGKINITLFKMKGVTLTKLSGPDVDVTVSNLKSLQDSNADLYVLVSNARAVSPYTTESEIDLKIKVEHQLWASYPDPEYCSLNGAAGSNVIIDTNDNPDDVTYVTCSYYGGDYGDYSGQLNQEIPYTNGEENGYAKFYWDGVLSGYYLFINGSIQ